MNMAKIRFSAAALAALALAACEGTVPYPGIGPDGELPVIARPYDVGQDNLPLGADTLPAVAYDPDGCQIWLIDDGAETYSGRRLDRASGLPVCNDQYQPGAVVRDYRANDIPDFVPRNPYGPFVGALAE
jgi:hypothetical protein